MMPGKSGDELTRDLRARPEFDRVPIVLLTAKADNGLRVQLLREGAQDYLTKPFSAEELRARVGNLVTLKRAQDVLLEAGGPRPGRAPSAHCPDGTVYPWRPALSTSGRTFR